MWKPGGEDLWAPLALGRLPACREGGEASRTKPHTFGSFARTSPPPNHPAGNWRQGPGRARPSLLWCHAGPGKLGQAILLPLLRSTARTASFSSSLAPTARGTGSSMPRRAWLWIPMGTSLWPTGGTAGSRCLVGAGQLDLFLLSSRPGDQVRGHPRCSGGAEGAPGPGRKSGLIPLIEAEAAIEPFFFGGPSWAAEQGVVVIQQPLPSVSQTPGMKAVA